MNTDTIKTALDSAFAAWQSADEEWHTLLVKHFGKKAGDARYDYRGAGLDPAMTNQDANAMANARNWFHVCRERWEAAHAAWKAAA